MLIEFHGDNYGGPYLPRQNLLFHGKTYFSTAKLTFPRQNLLFHGKTYFSTAKLTFPRQNLLFHGKIYFPTAKLTFLRQNLLFHGKTYFSTAKLHKVTWTGSVSKLNQDGDGRLIATTKSGLKIIQKRCS